LTNKGNTFKLNLKDLKGGEVDEMDVSPCNPLFDLRLDAQVLSKTLNGSTKDKRKILERKILKAGNFIPAFFSCSLIPADSRQNPISESPFL
jgi:hypothetical protein